MPHNRYKSMMFFTGASTALLGIMLYFALPFGHEYQLSLEPVFKSLSFEEVIGPAGPADWGTIVAELDLIIDSPREIQTGDAFVLELKVNLKQVSFLPSVRLRNHSDINGAPQNFDQMLTGPGMPPPQLTPEQLRDIIHQRIKRGEIAFLLSLAGAKIEPGGKNPVTEKGRIQWSIKPDGPGTLRGFLKPDFLQSSGGHSGEYRVEYSAADYLPVNVTVIEPIITTKSVVSAVATFFGTLLTLPGILAFLDERRKKIKERKTEEKKRQPIIILPDNVRSDDKRET